MKMLSAKSENRARVLVALALAALVSCAAFALAPQQLAYAEDSGSITLQYTGADTKAPLTDLQVNLYQVASVSGDQLVLTEPFMEIQQAIGWNADGTHAVSEDAAWLSRQAETMDGYVRAGWRSPDYTGTTNAQGALVFGNLQPGMYLILTVGDGIHLFTSTLVTIPTASGEDGVTYDLVVEPKVTTPATPLTEVKVVKHWKGDTNVANARPESITVQLICDEARYGEPVTLSDANGWTYTWEGLDASVTHQWDIAEINVPANYMVEIAEDGSVFSVTNSYNPPNPPLNPPTTETTTVPPTKLPQTGQLWWPVPVLFCAGLIAIGTGRIVSHRSRAK